MNKRTVAPSLLQAEQAAEAAGPPSVSTGATTSTLSEKSEVSDSQTVRYESPGGTWQVIWRIIVGLIAVFAVLRLSDNGRSALIDPGHTHGVTRTILSIVVGGSVGISYITLTLVLVSAMAWRMSPVPRQIAERVGFYAAYGATLGAIFGVRVVANEVDLPSVSTSYEWDFLDTIGRLATLGTLLGMSVAVVTVTRLSLRLIFRLEIVWQSRLAFLSMMILISLGLDTVYRVTKSLILGVGWQ
jgi:hypothetical protein